MTTKFTLAAALLLGSTLGGAVAARAQTPPPASSPSAPAMAPASKSMMAGGSMAATSTADLSAADKKFIMKAASAGMAEVQAAQLAQQKSQDGKVKDFAAKMITDHTANNTQLSTLAGQKGVTVPTALDDKDQAEIDKLTKLDEPKFDKVYLKGQVKDHKGMLELLKKEAKSGKDADLKSFAEQTIPVVQSHLDMAKADKSSS
jgi:putative membrane protein